MDAALNVADQSSPFSSDLGNSPTLPPAFREQFLLSPEQPYAVCFEGRMDRIWRRYAWLTPMFWLLARSNMLFPETGVGIPATMTIVASRDRRGLAQQRWNRTFDFGHTRRFDAVMGYDPASGQVIEQFGHSGWLEVAWRVRFQPPSTMEITTRGAAVRFGRLRINLPSFLCVAVHAVERADREHEDTIAIDLRLMLPLLGPVFGYTGSFRLRRVARPPEEVAHVVAPEVAH